MRSEVQLKKRREELKMCILLMNKYKISIAPSVVNKLKAQITNIDFLLDEDDEEDLKDV